MSNPFDDLAGLTDHELSDLMRGIRRQREERARTDGTDFLAAAFDQLNATNQQMVDGLEAAATDKETDQ